MRFHAFASGLALVLTLHSTSLTAAADAPAAEKLKVTLEEWTSFNAHEGRISNLAYAPDGKSFLTVFTADALTKHGSAALWDSQTFTLKWRFDDLPTYDSAISFNPAKSEVLVGRRLTDVASGKELRTVGTTDWVIKRAAFSPDGKRVVTTTHVPREYGDVGDGIAGWDLTKKDKDPLARLRPGGQLTDEQRFWWTALDWSRDGKWIVTVHSADHDAGEVGLWDGTNLALLNRFSGQSKRVEDAAISPDSKLIAITGKERTVKVWAIESLLPPAAKPEEIAKLIAALESDAVKDRKIAQARLIKLEGRAIPAVEEAAAKSKSDRVIAAAKEIIAAFQAREVKAKYTFTAPTNQKAVRFSADSKLLAASGDRGLLQVWNLTDPDAAPLQLPTGSGILAIGFSPDGHAITVGQSDGTVRVWRITPAAK